MARNPGRTVFIADYAFSDAGVIDSAVTVDYAFLMPNASTIGNLDEKVSERVLYEILIQAGHVVGLHVPSNKESNSHKGYAFAEYETEDIAQYAVRLFSGLVRINGKTLKFVIAGHGKPSSNDNKSVLLNPVPSSNANNPVMPKLNPIPLPKPTQIMRCSDMPVPHIPAYPVLYRVDQYTAMARFSNSTYAYNRQEFGSVLNIAQRGPVMNAFAHEAAKQPIMYPS
ncbi:Spliceosome-associated protein 49 [Zea mays]|uniref:Spliceosome-associated protein 49 n=1 Tax=Zea mays TaxID=4577 RepID=A0A3L6FCM4_MAIZE|nr:Spliceosome-associated protein 49 [Zea mays]